MKNLFEPWPWYIAGPLIGLTAPALLLVGNKKFGISSTLRQICAATVPAKIPFLNYNWRGDSWNLFFVVGIFIGGFIGGKLLTDPQAVYISQSTTTYFHSLGLNDPSGLLPVELFNWKVLFSLKGFLLIVVGGFLVGFGTRYARGCTSGHGIMGLASLQWTSLLATASFFIGGILFSRFILPYIIAL